MKKTPFILFLSLFFTSCEEDLNVDIPTDRSRLSVTSYLHADDYFNGQNSCVYVSNSISALESTDNFVYTDSVPVINNAAVSIYETNLLHEDVAAYLLDFNYDCYCYINTEFSPKPNTSYRLQVDVDGFPNVNARDKVPSKPSYEITDFEMLGQLDKKNFDGLLSQFNLVLFDAPNEENYYQLKIYAVNTSSAKVRPCSYSVSDASFLNPLNNSFVSEYIYNGSFAYFTDELFDGESKRLFVQMNKPKGSFDHFYIELRALSKDLYRFNETRKELNSDANNPLFVSEPIFLHSNIENGYGIFGGQSKSNKAYIPTYFPNNGWLEY